MNRQDRQGRQERRKEEKGGRKSFRTAGLCLAAALFLPLWAEACPRCFAASPYRIGFLWAVALLLPVPFVLAGWLFWWIRKASKAEFPNY